MLRFQVITLFPDLFLPFRTLGLVGRAVETGLISVETLFLRDFAINNHGQVDDTPYGGGSGMVLRPEPAVAAIERASCTDPQAEVILFTPRGERLTRGLAKRLAQRSVQSGQGLILLCPRYEGVDERVYTWVDREVSLGDFVLMGGELPAMALIEAVSRFVPGVLGNPDSLSQESFEENLLEYPQYTKPQEYRGLTVPPILLSGHHAKIEEWRKSQALRLTNERRPDLLARRQDEHDRQACSTASVFQAEPETGERPRAAGLPRSELSIALIHYPVVDKNGDVVTSSITNIDMHDIARSARTFGVSRFYVVHPTKELRKLMRRICGHWSSGYGFTYNRNRQEALSLVSLVPDLEDVMLDIEERTGFLPSIITTSARRHPQSTTFVDMKKIFAESESPHLLLFGTGWGLADELLERADYRLEPLEGFTDYNHLSVRAAAAIVLDRLLGKC